uniref:Protein kinase domain-containing protein n=1 Tax=Strongyloides stercoralis TaxID=6248 RepID=A0A0K0DXT1_STRER
MNVSNVMKATLDDYIKLEKIREGTYGVVYKSKHVSSGKVVALKKIKMEADREGVPPSTIREIAMLREVKHPNIVSLEGTILKPNRVYLIFEFIQSDLRKYLDQIQKGQLMESNVVMSFLYQICQAICFCHQRRILHRDLKPENLLVTNNKCIKLADFGLARTIGIPLLMYTHEIATLWYRSPEILLGAEKYSTAVDVWSIACIFGEMASCTPLFEGDSEIDQLYKIFQKLGTPNQDIWPGVASLPGYKMTFPIWKVNNIEEKFKGILKSDGIKLLHDMLIYDPIKRINVKSILKHDYFKRLDKTKLPCAEYNGDIFIEN